MSNELTSDLIVVSFEMIILNVVILYAVADISMAEANLYSEQGEQAPIQ